MRLDPLTDLQFTRLLEADEQMDFPATLNPVRDGITRQDDVMYDYIY